MKYYCRTNTKEVAFCFCHLLFPGLMKAREGDLYLRNEELLNQLHQPIIGGAQGIFTISLDKPMGLGLTSDAAVDNVKPGGQGEAAYRWRRRALTPGG